MYRIDIVPDFKHCGNTPYAAQKEMLNKLIVSLAAEPRPLALES
ncbi:hypothetical protein [Neptuniibacter sp. QD34_54]